MIVRLIWDLILWCGLMLRSRDSLEAEILFLRRQLALCREHSRRLIHFNVTAHPTAQWTRQQLREAVGHEERYEYLLHDRDAIFSAELDKSIRRLGPGVPDPPADLSVPLSTSRHRLDDFRAVHAKAILGELHHEYLYRPSGTCSAHAAKAKASAGVFMPSD